MKREDIRAHIRQAAKSFDAELHTRAYAELLSDAAQLRRLLSYLTPQGKQVLLDLGTGSGYVAMALAKREPTSQVIGLDVAAEAIRKDAEIAKQEALSNVSFCTFDGVTLPFGDDTFDAAVCRYVLHHLPCCETTLREIARTVRPQGRFVLADAIRNEEDETDFINRFQKLKPDGHVRMHRSEELIEMVCRSGFELIDRFETSISFARTRRKEYDELLASTPEGVQESYQIGYAGEEIHLRFRILNAAFVNRRTATLRRPDC